MQIPVLTNRRSGHIFKQVLDLFEEDQHEVLIRLATSQNRDRRCRNSNLPTADEVAVVIPDEETHFHRRDGPLCRIGNGSPM